MNVKQFAVATLLALSLLIVVSSPMSTQQAGEYEAWVDLNDDGVIDIYDLISVATKFGSEGTPITKTSIEYDSGWIDITDKCGQYFNITHNLNSTDLMVDITGKTTMSGGAHQRYLGGTGYTPGWSRTYGGTNDDFCYSMVETSDGGYAIAGHTLSYGAGRHDFWLVKTDSDGNMQWNRTYGGTGEDSCYSVVETSDGGYAMAGATVSYGGANWDFWLVKTDSSGNRQWNKTYGGTYVDWGYCAVQTGDGGYAIAGGTSRNSTYGNDIYLVKTDLAGNLIWERTYGGTGNDCAYSVVQTSDGGYALTGTTYSYGAGVSDVWLVKTDSSGNRQWNRTYGGTSEDGAWSLVQTGDGGYALAGWTWSFGAGDQDVWLVKTDSSGNRQWNKTYGGTGRDGALSLVQTSHGGFAIAGYTSSYGAGSWDFWLVKTDSSGNRQWNRTYGGTSEDSAWSLVQTGDGGYALAGYTWSYGASGANFWLVKTGVESGLAWTDSTADTITLYRGATDPYWNYVRVRIWKVKETP